MLIINWTDYEQLLLAVFSCFQEQKKYKYFWKYCSVCTKKLHNISYDFFLPQNRLILKFSNLILLHKGLLMENWVFRLGVEPWGGAISIVINVLDKWWHCLVSHHYSWVKLWRRHVLQIFSHCFDHHDLCKIVCVSFSAFVHCKYIDPI